MQLPTSIARKAIILEDEYFDLKGLSLYSKLGISSLRYHIRNSSLPVYCIRGDKNQVTKILIRKSEFNRWMQRRWRDDIGAIADEVLKDLVK